MSSGHSSSADRNGVEMRTNLKRKMPPKRRKFGARNEQNENRFVVPYI